MEGRCLAVAAKIASLEPSVARIDKLRHGSYSPPHSRGSVYVYNGNFPKLLLDLDGDLQYSS